jgi:hypothetical protein
MATHTKGHTRYRRIRTRVISTGVTTEQVQNDDFSIDLKVDIQSRQFTGKLQGRMDRSTGDVKFDILEQAVTSYLKKHHFKVVGYTLEARVTNVNRRAKGKVLGAS